MVPTLVVTAPATAPANFTFTWSGTDSSAGIRHYDVQVRDALTPTWTGWLTDTTAVQAQFTGLPGHSYYFRVRATDRVNNVSGWQAAGPVVIQSVTKYYSFGSSRVAMRQGDVVYYLHGDHLGSVSLTTDESGAGEAQSRYLPYGQERWSSGSSPTDFGFTGQREEAGFGLMDYNARYYSPVLGRFVSADSVIPDLANPQSLNRYSYAYNNPIKYTDPTGHEGEPWEWAVKTFRNWACGGWNSISECPVDTIIRATGILPTNPEDILQTAQNAAGLDNSSLPHEPLITPTDLQNVQRFVNAFQAVEGGVSSWNEFQHAAKGSFVGENASKANVGWQVYKQANQSDDILVLGRQVDTDAWYGEEGYQILRIPQENWAIPVNDSWLQGGIDRGATFRVVSPIEDSLWNEFDNRPTVLARELEQLRQAGYTLSDDSEYMLPPQH